MNNLNIILSIIFYEGLSLFIIFMKLLSSYWGGLNVSDYLCKKSYTSLLFA